MMIDAKSDMILESLRQNIRMSHKSHWAQIIVEIIEAEYGSTGINALRTPESKRTPWQRDTVSEIIRRIIGPDPQWLHDVNEVLMR